MRTFEKRHKRNETAGVLDGVFGRAESCGFASGGGVRQKVPLLVRTMRSVPGISRTPSGDGALGRPHIRE